MGKTRITPLLAAEPACEEIQTQVRASNLDSFKHLLRGGVLDRWQITSVLGRAGSLVEVHAISGPVNSLTAIFTKKANSLIDVYAQVPKKEKSTAGKIVAKAVEYQQLLHEDKYVNLIDVLGLIASLARLVDLDPPDFSLYPPPGVFTDEH